MIQNNNDQRPDLWAEAPEIFPSRKSIAKFVSERFERSQRSVLRDLSNKQQGQKVTPKCFPRPDGQGYDLTEIQRYVQAEGLEIRPEWGGNDPSLEQADVSELKRRKLLEEARKIKAQASRHELDLAVARGELVPKESRDRMLAQRLRLLKQGLRIELRNAAPDLLNAAGGDPTLLSQFKQQCVELAESIFSKWYAQGVEHDGNIEINESGTEYGQAENT